MDGLKGFPQRPSLGGDERGERGGEGREGEKRRREGGDIRGVFRRTLRIGEHRVV